MTASAQPNPMQERRHRLLSDVAEHVQVTAIQLGIKEDIAEHVGHAVADFLAEHWAGQQVNFPLKDAYGLAPRERAIAADLASNMRIYEIALKYHMTERGVRKLIARLEARGHIQPPPQSQRDLFS